MDKQRKRLTKENITVFNKLKINNLCSMCENILKIFTWEDLKAFPKRLDLILLNLG